MCIDGVSEEAFRSRAEGRGLSLIRLRNRDAVRILMYHRFAGMESAFAAQCDHLLEHYRPISLTEAHRRLSNGDSLPPGSVVITVDDGYRDFYTSAFPILKTRGIPAIVFLVSEFIDGHIWLWTEQVRYALERTGRKLCEIPIGGRDTPMRLPLGSPAERRKSIEALKYALKIAPNRHRLETMAALPGILGVEILAKPPKGLEPVRWDQVREMANEGMEFGSHTRTHPILSRVESEEELESEIAGCRTRIEQELQRSVPHFCYPNGQAEDLNENVLRVVRSAGYVSGVSTTFGLNRRGADLFRLRRYGVNPDVSQDWFERTVAGLYRDA